MNTDRNSDMSDPGSSSRQLADKIRTTLVHQIYTQALTGFSGALLGAIVLTVSLWDLLPRSYLTLWLGLYVLAHLVRQSLVRSYFKVGPDKGDPWTWERKLALGNFFGGAMWGLAGIALFPENSVQHQYMLALFVAGISCGAAAFYWPSTAACLPTILVELLPLAGRFFYQGHDTGILTGIVILMFCVVVLLMARHLKSFGVESVRLRLEKEGLLESLWKSRDELETRVQERTTELSQVNEALVSEIEERTQAEESLRKSEERYRLVVDNVQESIFVSQDGLLKFANPRTVELYQYSEQELLSKPFTEFIHPDDREMVYQKHVKRLSGEDFPKRYSFRILHKTGAIKWVEITNVAIQWDGRAAALAFMTDITSRKEAEEALRQSEERYRSFFDTSRDAVFMTTLDGQFIDVNDSALELFGCAPDKREDLLGKNVAAFYAYPEERNAHAGLVARMGFLKEYPVDLRKKDGTIIHALITTVVRKDHDGSVIGFQGTIRDVTDRKHAEDALRESEEQYRVLFDSINDALFVHEVNEDGSPGCFIQVNDAACQRLGYARDELLKMKLGDIVDPESYRKLSAKRAELLTKNRALFEGVHVAKDGRRIIVESSVRLFQCRGKPAAISISRDITERKKAEQELRESEQRFRALLEDVSSVPVQGYDEERRVVFWNSASERLYGYSREEALGRRLEDLIIPSHMRDGVVAAIHNWVTNGERIQAGELGLMHKDGSVVPVYSTHVMLDAPRGGKELYCVDLDLADLKKAEEERAVLRDQLRESQKMEAIGTLAGGVAHDFNNLLQVTLGFSELLLQDKGEGHPDHADLWRIFQAAKSGAELVQRLLTFSRKVEPQLVPMSLNKAIVQVAKLLRRTIPKMIDIQTSLCPNLATINADSNQMEQIVINLAINARDAMPDGGKLTISTETVTLDEEARRLHVECKPGEYVLLTVTDTGHGMSREIVERIFEPFFTTKELGRGTGLGLAMVYGIVRQHNGYVRCTSVPGRGTTFQVYFPATEPGISPQAQETIVLPSSGTETLLLVDDEEFVRDLGSRILSKAGYVVLAARDCREALDLFRKGRPGISLVILDLIMPHVGGKDCLMKIIEIDPAARVLVASGDSSDRAVRECTELGVRGFVAKPFRFKDLLTAVRKALDET